MDPNPAQPTDERDAAADVAPPSDQPQEAESGFMNRMLRGLARSVGLGPDDQPSDRVAETEGADAEAAPPADQQPSRPAQPTEAEIQERIRREAQSLKDRELVRDRRDWAKSRADQGDLEPIRQLAEKGDGWAQRALAENGDTWALGEIKQRELREAQARENDPLPVMAAGFDQAVLHPLLGALPKSEEERIVGQGIVGLDGRQAAVTDAIASLKKHAAEEALTKALDDESYARKLVGESSALRRVLLTHPVLSKQLRAMFRGDLEEPDLIPGNGPGGGTVHAENATMNQMIRGLARDAEYRAPYERAAGAGARNGRAVNLDLLDDE